MAEPTTATVGLAGIALAGVAGASTVNPTMAGLALIVVAAISGGAVQLSTQPPQTKGAAAFYLLSTAGMALALTGAVAYSAERFLGIPAVISGTPIAFMIGARREWVLSKITSKVDTL
jgi:hypothetical protein